jgi:lysophospholipase L1-like esterase
VFLGDSITDWWKNDGRATWDQFYEPLGSVNTGVAGDRTTTIIDRINNQGIIDNLNAYMAVLKIGTNDLSGNVPEQTVADNINTIISLIKSKNPGVKILLLGILPRGGSEIHSRIQTVNSLIARYANGNDVFFLNMEAQFSTGLGQVVPQLYWDDQLHLSSAGYVKWAETMNPVFDEILHSPRPAKAGMSF